MKIGQNVRVIAFGDDCVKHYEGVEGKVVEFNRDGFRVDIQRGYNVGGKVFFEISNRLFRYQVINKDWDD